MISYNPTLNIKTLHAFKNAKEVLYMEFHNGLNVIHGSNGSGKTSVIQLLTYALGATVYNWKEEAGSCDYVIAEIYANESTITIGREIKESSASMNIFFGDYAESLKNGKTGWFNYPYSISPSRESFSQKLFEILNIPEAKSDGINNLTMHQILRVVYNNQSSPATSIFNDEPFDSAIKREFVSNYLLGLYDDNLYSNKLELIKKDKELTKTISELKGLYLLVDGSDTDFSFSSTEEHIEQLQLRIDLLINSIEEKKNIDLSINFKNETKATSPIEIVKLKKDLLFLEISLKQLDYNISDSTSFIEELKQKILAIEDSMKFGKYYKAKEFDTCPSCFSLLKSASDENNCSLCGTHNASNSKNMNYARMKNEISIQLKESSDILAKHEKEKEKIALAIKETKKNLRAKINKISIISNSLNSDNDSSLYDAYREVGELEEKINSLSQLSKIYLQINKLRELRNTLQDRVSHLESEIDKKETALLLKLPKIQEKITGYMIEILSKDLENIEDPHDKAEFSNITSIGFDLASNRIIINNKVSFSESSMYYLNNALHISLLKLSLTDKAVRFPRLLILDGIENGGMEDIRSKGIQKTIKEISDEFDGIRHQVIVTTKGINAEVDNSKYRVGDKFTSSNRSLKM
ncbi:AAA family ATPase [Candidatus Pantoea multigeneris]|uniref:AAA family ATPase n=1 Tax=Candidatus Pantoea multigeneris TaxID=2608357 RepID=A0ABX0RBT9_9GAMM|nr:AAA family ATPase [Pantoea multigeneris]NIF22557.1 AAA family ATPase [Pantoea multigeneris]